jgi:hypothetical protein
MAREFRIMCDHCGRRYFAASLDTPGELAGPDNQTTFCMVDLCPGCVHEKRPISWRAKFMIEQINEIERLKALVENLRLHQ